MACLEESRRLHRATGGAFDPTVGALYACWRRAAEQGREPEEKETAEARQRTGMQHVMLDPVAHTARVGQKGVRLDLSAIGKGYAIEKAARLLEEWGVRQALLSGGGSTVLALDPPGLHAGWLVKAGRGRTLRLSRRALSASGLAVKGAHIFDPRTGRPVRGRVRAWASASSATVSDALSTAFLVMSEKELQAFCAQHADIGAQVQHDQAGKTFSVHGAWPQ
jgi:thiamine biosynthesis lipoprotein